MSTSLVPYSIYEAQNAYQRLQASLSESPLAAIAEVKTFLKMFPDVAMAHNDLGVLYHKMGEPLQSLAHYEKANRLQPNTPTIIKNLAEFYCVVLGWTEDAICMLTGLLKAYPDDFEVLTALGAISSQVGRHDEARIFFRKALEIDPNNRELRDRLAQVEGPISTAEYRPVQPIVQEAETPLPSVAVTDEYSGAVASFEQMVTQNPTNALAHNNLGIIWTRRGDYEKAGRCHELAVRYDPENAIYKKNLADLYFVYLGRTDEAIEMYTELLKSRPKDTEVLSALAIISRANQLQDQARTFIRKVLELEPWNVEAREFLAGL